MAPIIDPAHLEAFDRDGYCVVTDALPPAKVGELLGAVNRVKDRLAASPHRLNVPGLDVRPIVTEDDEFLSLLEWPATFPLAVRCLGHYSLQLNTSHLIMVEPRHVAARNVGWHQDGGSPSMTVGGIKPMFSLKIGYFLTDLLEPDMGQLMVVPGSHRKAGDLPRQPDGDPVGAVQLRVKAGSAVVFGNPVWHGTAPNLSTSTRIVLYFGYAYRWLKPIDYHDMPEALIARCGPVGRQLLGVKASHLGNYIPTEADCPLKAKYAEWFGETWIH